MKLILITVVNATALMASWGVDAQTYPSKPVRVTIGTRKQMERFLTELESLWTA